MDLNEFKDVGERLRGEIRKVIVGQDNAIDLIMLAILCNGHVLIEGVPGTAKTLMARTFAAAMDLDMKRIQFTPDMLPGDILGTNIFDFRTNEFHLTKGPIFTEILLADEINRTPPKTQAALLQAMHEREVTIDGKTHALGPGFITLATQNPIEHQGTYPLPEAQLDRFLFKIVIEYPSAEEEYAIVKRHGHKPDMPRIEDHGVQPVLTLDDIISIRNYITGLRASDEIVKYVVDVIRATRDHADFLFGASPRAANMLTSVSKAYAALNGRDFVIPDDVKALALPALRHRVVMGPGAEIEGKTSADIIAQILDTVPAPR